MTPAAVADLILYEGDRCRNVVFTGGEPLLQQEGIAEVMEILNAENKNWFYNVETNGTIELSYKIKHLRFDWICVSPKVKPEAIKLEMAHEVKVVFTEQYAKWLPEYYDLFPEAYRYSISPVADSNNPYTKRQDHEVGDYPSSSNVHAVMKYIKENPQWRLNLQTHKILNIR